MIKKFSIRNFKCFEEIVTKPWDRVNLIAGENNIGKTTLLEAIFLHEGAHNAALTLSIEKFRGITSFNNKDFLDELFTKFKSEREIILETEYQDGKILTLKITQEESKQPKPIDIEGPEILQGTVGISPRIIFEGRDNGEVCTSWFFLGVDNQGKIRPFSKTSLQSFRPVTMFVSIGLGKDEKNKINVDRFTALVEKKRKGEIIESLKLVDDRLQDLELGKKGETNIIFGDIGYGKMLPLCLMGEGMERYLSFVLSILSAENGIVLIDEIENGFHHSIYINIWSNLAMLSRKYNVQVIATTHSYECIVSAHKSFKQNGKYDFILHRLDRIGERIEDVTYDKETLEAAIESNMEIR